MILNFPSFIPYSNNNYYSNINNSLFLSKTNFSLKKPHLSDFKNNPKSIQNHHNKTTANINNIDNFSNSQKKGPSSYQTDNADPDEYLFNFLGLKIYFDDILIICILLFLYSEKVKDEGLFLCLLLLLLP